MTPCELSVALNTAANAMAANLSNEELALLTAMFRQMYESLTGILLLRRSCADIEKKRERCSDREENRDLNKKDEK